MKEAKNSKMGNGSIQFQEPSDNFVKFGEYQYISKINSAQYIQKYPEILSQMMEKCLSQSI